MKNILKTLSVIACIFSVVSSLPCSAAPLTGASLEAKVDSIVARQNVTARTPGCAIAVVRDGEIIFKKGYGSANLDYDIPITPQTVFNIGSISKQFAASAIQILAGEGKLALDDDIRKYLPDFPEYGHTITIRHLLHHISGIRDYEALMVPANMPYDKNYSPEELYEFITRQRELNFVPGAEFSYSNSGFVLLGMIVKKVSGLSLGEFTAKRIFEPFGMKNSFFYEKMHVIVRNRATGYDKDGSGYITGLYDNYTVGASNLCTTVEDLARWDRNFYGSAVGGPDFIANMLDQGVLNDGEVIDYACGLRVSEYKGLKTVSHNGWWAGFRAGMVRFPDQRFTVICLSNTTGFNPYSVPYMIADLCLSDVLKPVSPAETRINNMTAGSKQILSAPEATAYTGDYYSDELRVTYAVAAGGDGLVLKTPITYDFVGYHFITAENSLIRLDADSFGTGELTVDFQRGTGGAVTGLVLGIPSVKLKLRFTRK
ncbi:beta-lactamase family protein [bacterium]|nr:beta-lactamase family protein [bacterium]